MNGTTHEIEAVRRLPPTRTKGMLRAAALACALCAFHAAAEPLTRQQGDAILQELRSIRQLLERQKPAAAARAAPAERLKVRIDGAHAIGAADAPVTMVAFVDYECPFCKRFDVQTYPELKKRYIDTGRLRYVVRDLPLEFHRKALKAAEATHCAAEQGKYWQMRDKLIANSERLEAESLLRYADEIDLRGAGFRDCFESNRYAEQLKKGVADAASLGISGTPTFVIGRSTRGEVVEGVKVVGAQPYVNFEQHIRALLDGKDGS